MRSLVLAAAVISMGALSSASAQTPPAAPAAPSAAPATAAPAPADAGKRIVCRQDVTAKGLRGQDGRDAMQLCMAEGQVDCIKQAISQKVAGAQRKDFLKTCMGRKVGGDR